MRVKWLKGGQIGSSISRKLSILACGILLFFLFSACGLLGGSGVDQAELKWRQQSVASYRIEVLEVNSIWHSQAYTITIRNGQIVDSSTHCVPAPAEGGKCKVEAFDPNTYTVPGLFGAARARAADEQAKWLKITFDSTYGYPNQISYDNPDILDEDWLVRVTTFEVLK
jgi:hypothetical protein